MTGPAAHAPVRPVPDISLAERLFAEFRDRTADSVGVTRMSYGPGEQVAHDIVRREADALGLTVETDAACNLYATLAGAADGPRLVIGSHLDSVPRGGNFDGAAGVLMGLSVVSGLVATGIVPPMPVTVMAIRAEESAWFATSYIGSRAALGRLPAEDIDTVIRDGDAMLLRDAIKGCGGDPHAVAEGPAFLDPASLSAFIEPHIEQGPSLIAEDRPVGLVTHIRGSIRHRAALCYGAYAHSGTTPQDARQDAVRAVSHLVVDLDQLWTRMRQDGHDLTVTVGQFETDPSEASFSKVSGKVRFSLDIRSNAAATLERISEELKRLVLHIETKQNVRFDLGPRTGSTPVAMDARVTDRLNAAAAACGVDAIRMPCGAGHDAAAFAAAGVPTGMLFIRNRNGSHNPDEDMAITDFGAAAEVLMRYCLAPDEAAR